ncbi:MAG: sugar phosphate isomerase/epimerase [Rhodothermales bacterium]|jgi:sugar phosphate isomerase/epimerase
MTRSDFLKTGAATAAVLGGSSCHTISPLTQPLALGFDNFSIRAKKWNATQVLEYAGKQKVDTLLFSDLDVYEHHEPAYLAEVAAQAAELGIALQAGTGSICGTAANFKKKHGPDIQHLTLTITVAKHLGASVVRCYQGSAKDRQSRGGLQPHMDRTVAVCKSVESYAKDSGVKIAIENHAGDMTAWQLKQLIERAGPDFVGATIDAGNAAFTLEDPVENLRILGPYVLSSGIRDTVVWHDGDDIKTWWKAMGAGNVDWAAYFALWRKLCPQAPVQLEIISQWGKTVPPKANADFWQHYGDIRDRDYKAFVKIAATGTAPEPPTKARFTGDFMLQDLEASLAFCRDNLCLGIRGGSV